MTVMEVWVTIKIKYSPAFGDTQEDGGGTDDQGREVTDGSDGDDDNDGDKDEILTGIERKVGDTHEDGGGTDDKGQEVSEGGDGDADSSAGQSLAQDLRHVLDRLLLDIAGEVLTPRGHQQEHVVHADP